MSRILGTLILILAILLFPPSVLALISNNSIPGDVAYPIKISLERGVVFLTYFNPTTRAWFSVTRSERRFQETTTLLAAGKDAGQSLNDLVTQTDIAVTQISQITDQNQKQEFIANLQKSIQKYDDGLSAVQERQSIQTAPPIFPVSTPLPAVPSPLPTSTLTPKSAPLPTPVPSQKPQSTPTPTTPAPTIQPISQTATVTTEVSNNEANNKEEIKKAREKLEEIKNKLKVAKEEKFIQNNIEQLNNKDQSIDNHPSKK